MGRGYPRFWTYIFKSHSLPSMWRVLVEFGSASSEGMTRIIAVKPTFADNYVVISTATATGDNRPIYSTALQHTKIK